jgi:T-complex protein 1 subunit alpha
MLTVDYQLDEMERSLHDSLSVIKRTLESGSVVPGGGAVETALSIYLENFATSVGSREQLAIAEFASALLIIPKLRAYHASSQNATQGEEKKRRYRFYGLDLMEGRVRNNLEAGVLEPSMSKVRSLKSAVEACISILRIDTAIKVDPKPVAEDPHGH